MRRIDRVDLSTLNPTTIATPPTGEKLIHDSKAIGLALRLRASGARTWITLATKGGKTVRRTLGDATTMPPAIARLLAESSNGDPTALPAPSQFPPSASLTLVMEAYLASGQGRHWTTSTGRLMRCVAKHHIVPALGDRPVREIAGSEVLCWHSELARRTSSARMALSTLSGMMRYAEDHGLREPGSNPCRGLRKKGKSNRGSHLAPALVRRIWSALDRYQPEMSDACDAIRLLLLTGARKGEILGLRWDRIAGVRAVLDLSKTGPRTIWLNAQARGILDSQRKTASGAFVFPGARRKGPVSSIDRQWNTIRIEAGAPALRLHDLRHHYAAVGVSCGIDLKVIGGLLGHHDIDSTLIYAHLTTDTLVRSADRVSRIIGKASGQDRPPSIGRRRRPKDRAASVGLPGTSNRAEVRHA